MGRAGCSTTPWVIDTWGSGGLGCSRALAPSSGATYNEFFFMTRIFQSSWNLCWWLERRPAGGQRHCDVQQREQIHWPVQVLPVAKVVQKNIYQFSGWASKTAMACLRWQMATCTLETLRREREMALESKDSTLVKGNQTLSLCRPNYSLI